MLTTCTKTFADFDRLQQRVSQAIGITSDCLSQIEALDRAEQLLGTQRALESDTFKVLVVGEFKRGKSTAINAMLGAKLLPAKVAPCTAVITRVKFGERKQATLHHRQGSHPTQLDLESDPTSLSKHLVIDHTQDDLEDAQLSPYVAADVFFPLELLRNRVELVDSPGLNEHATRTAVTHAFLSEADAMVLVLSCAQFLSQSERKFLDQELANRDLKDVFFLCNRYDDVRDAPDELQSLQRLAQEVLGPRVRGKPRLYFVASQEALAGKLQDRPELVATSNLPDFMQALEHFLSAERGRVKLTTPIRICEHAISEALLHLLPQREGLFRQPLEVLRQKLDVERPRLDEAERQCERTLRNVEQRTEAMIREAQASWRSFLFQLELDIVRHAKTIDVSTWDAICSQSETSRKLAAALEDWLGGQLRQWEQGQLQPLLEIHWRTLIQELDVQTASFLDSVAQVRAALGPHRLEVVAARDISAMSRLMGAGLGLLNVGAMIEGAALGVGPAVKGLALNVATVVMLQAMSFTLPVILPVVVGIGVVRTLSGAKQTTESIRENVSTQMIAGIRKHLAETEQAIEQQITAAVLPLQDRVRQQMNNMVDEIRNQVTVVIAERERSQIQVDQELARLRTIRQQLTAQLQVVQQVLIELG